MSSETTISRCLARSPPRPLVSERISSPIQDSATAKPPSNQVRNEGRSKTSRRSPAAKPQAKDGESTQTICHPAQWNRSPELGDRTHPRAAGSGCLAPAGLSANCPFCETISSQHGLGRLPGAVATRDLSDLAYYFPIHVGATLSTCHDGRSTALKVRQHFADTEFAAVLRPIGVGQLGLELALPGLVDQAYGNQPCIGRKPCELGVEEDQHWSPPIGG